SGHALTAWRDVEGVAAPNALLVIGDCNGCGDEQRPIDFGTAGSPIRRSVYVRNTGAQTATMMAGVGLPAGAFAWTGTGTGGAYPGAGASCGTTLAPGMSCWLDITFSPGGPGNYTGTVGITYIDGAGNATATHALAGAGTNAALLVIHDWSDTDSGGSSEFDFGVTGVPLDHVFTATTARGRPASLMMSGGAMGGGLDWQGGGGYPGGGGKCAGSLAVGASCTVVVTFTPAGSGPRSGALSIRYFDGAGTVYAARKLAATA